MNYWRKFIAFKACATGSKVSRALWWREKYYEKDLHLANQDEYVKKQYFSVYLQKWKAFLRSKFAVFFVLCVEGS